MSIEDRLAQALEDERLYELESSLTGREMARTMIVSPDIAAIITQPFPDTPMGERHGELAAWLESFVEGGEFSVAEDPDNKPEDTMLARVHPVEEEFWSIRVTEPPNTPGMRVLGAFASKDTFVALVCECREDMPDFDEDVQSAIDAWRDILGEDPPFKGETLDAYLSNYRAV